MTKVLFLAPCPYNLDLIKGGVEAVTVNLLLGFKDIQGIEIRTVSFQKLLRKEKFVQYSKNIVIQFVPFGRIKSTKMEMLFHGRIKVRNIVEEFQPDIVHVQGNGSILMLTYGLQKDNIIMTTHGILKEELKQQNTILGKISYLINILTESCFGRSIGNQIFISKYNENLIRTKKILYSRVIYNPVHTAFFEIAHNGASKINNILYVGGIMKRKGLKDLITVFQSFKNKQIEYNLAIVGGIIEKSYKKEIDDIIYNDKLSSKIIFHDWLSQKEILKLMSEVSILVLPSYQETLPVTIAEAMSAGKVVVATKVGGIPEMIQDKVTGFLYEKGDLKELESILTKLYTNNELINKVSENARMSAKRMFSAISVAEQTLYFYDEVTNNRILKKV
jgi:glycosyltransferase involved in cell wall biosynthesis